MRNVAAAVVMVVTLAPCTAAAQTTVTVLGLRSASAEESVAHNLTAALRQAADAARAGGFQHTGRANTLEQLLIAFGCDEPTPSCLRQIGESLRSDRLVYGLVERESGRQNADYAVTLTLFNVATGENERRVHEVVPRASTSVQELAPIASRFLTSLAGGAVRAELAVRSNVSGARVLVDGVEVGVTSSDPVIIRNLEPGEITVAVLHDEYTPFERRVTVEGGGRAELQAPLERIEEGPDDQVVGPEPTGPEPGPEGPGPEPGPGPRPRRNLSWIGWSSFGLGVVLAGLGLWSSLEVHGANTEGALYDERRLWSQNSDVCGIMETADESRSGARPSDIVDQCNTGSLFETLQFVFYGLGAAATAVGLYFVISETLRASEPAEDTESDESEDDELSSMRRLEIQPIVWGRGGALSARLSF